MSSAVSTAELQLRRARQELERALRAGRDARAEQFLGQHPELAADPEAAMELAYTEYVLRAELGQNPDPAEWFARFPHWHADLKQVFEVDRELRSAEMLRGSGATLPIVRRAERAPEGVPGYEVLDELGRGGMGVVYRANQIGLNRPAALKVILSGRHAGERDRERFRREAEAAARLDHPNIVRIFEVGEAEGRPFCAMEFVEGGTLADKLDGTPWPFGRAADLVAILADAVQHAHERGIVHRDLKPANILMQCRAAPAGDGPPAESPEPSPKIADFGLAKFITDSEAAAGPTRSGDLVGTPAYMAPEQAGARADRIGPPTDIWALGVLLYELLTGHLPFQGDSPGETLDQVRLKEPVPPRQLRPNLPADLQTICLKALTKTPAGRYASAADLAADLRRWRAGEPILARPVSAIERGRRWCRRNPRVAALAALASLLLASTLLFGALALVKLADASEQSRKLADQEQNARRQAEADTRAKEILILEGQRRMTRLRVADGVRRMDDGDLSGAAVILAHAFEHDPDTANEEIHRIRIGAALRAMPELRRYDIHDATINAGGCFSGDGTHVCFIEPDGLRRMYDAIEGDARMLAVRPAPRIVSERLNLDGRVLARIFPDSAAAVDLETGQAVPLPMPIDYAPLPPPFSADGERHVRVYLDKRLVSGPGSFNFNRLEVCGAAGRPVGPAIVAPAGRFRCYDLSRDGRRAATGDPRGSVQVWNPTTAAPGGTEFRLTASVQAVRFNADATRLAAAATNGTAQIWNLETGEPVGRTIFHGPALHDLQFSDDQQRVLTWSNKDRTVRLWDAATGNPVGEQIRFSTDMARVLLHPNGSDILAVGVDGTLRVWDALTGDPVSPPLYGASEAQFAPDSNCLVSASTRGALRTWALEPLQPLAHVQKGMRGFWSKDGKRIIAIGGGQQVILDATTRTLLNRSPLAGQLQGALEAAEAGLVLHQPGREESRIRVWDHDRGEFSSEPIALRTGFRGQCRLASDRLAIWEPDGVIRVRRIADGAVLGDPLPHAEPGWDFQATPDGTRLLTHGRVPRIWDTERGRLVAELADVQPARECKLSADGRHIAAITRDGRLMLHDPRTGEALGSGFPIGEWSTKLALSADGSRCATVNPADRSAQAWDAATGRRVGLPITLSTDLFTIAFSPDGRFLAVGTRTGVVQVWHVESGTPVTPPLGRGREIDSIAFRPDGRALLVNNFDGRIWLWSLEPDPRPAAELADAARMLANRTLDDRGALVKLSRDEERRLHDRFWK